jgi:hypothetical protein
LAAPAQDIADLSGDGLAAILPALPALQVRSRLTHRTR